MEPSEPEQPRVDQGSTHARTAGELTAGTGRGTNSRRGMALRLGRLLRAFLFLGIKQHETAIDVLWLIAVLLMTGDAADSGNRVFNSKHVADLRLICAVAFVALVWITTAIVIIGTVDAGYLAEANVHGFRQFERAFNGPFLKLFVPSMAVFGAILAWAYQVGSARLGVVDLFACEIDTLCRMITVNDGVSRQISRYAKGPPDGSSNNSNAPVPMTHFVSEENYFPVFDGDVRDLQTLEARVVVNITAFYTYLKAVRDSMRGLGAIKPEAGEVGPLSEKTPLDGPWRESLRNMIYMLYLGLESARKAIDDLVEFEPEQAERKIVILLSELAAYSFLCAQFADTRDYRHNRLELRRQSYLRDVPELSSLVTEKIADLVRLGRTDDGRETPRQWVAAGKLLPELAHRLKQVETRQCETLENARRTKDV